MAKSLSERWVKQVLDGVGIQVNGSNPWDIQVKNPGFYSQVLRNPELKLGEAYVAGWWECERIDEFFARLLTLSIEDLLKSNLGLHVANIRSGFYTLYGKLCNLQTKSRAKIVGQKHYDLGNDFYTLMLDKRMNYSCGYWKNATTLDEAQEAKLDLICRKLQLEPGMRVLDIGCGWGGFSKYAAEHYGASVVGVTVSREQQKLAQELCQGLPVDIQFRDYRDVNEKFDRICSVGMFEHVGFKNYETYFATAKSCMKPDGLFLLHTIGNNYATALANPWIRKYIFPNGMVPSIGQIGDASEKLLVMEDWHNFGPDYDKTLMAWYDNFNANWPLLQNRYTEEFRRMWNYYLLSCAGSFRARDMQLWQVVFSHQGLPGVYESVR